ncbi:MAG TPA: ROK family protein [Vicinamibacterales bacterium]|nr:ROK family protein [Vicinamibacterales bacterium]
MRIGIDVGGTKIEAIGLASDGTIRARRRVDAPRGDYERTVKTLVDLVEAIELDTGERGSVGLGIPGTISPATGWIKNANSTWLNGQPLDRDLSRALNRPVRLANDANCFALSEATDGAAAGAGVVFGVIIGTGCGGGVVVHGRLLTGANAVAGEWGHNGLPWPDESEWPGPPCYCGRQGCIETFLSGRGMQAAYGDSSLTAREIAESAAKGDARAAAAIERYATRLAKGLASVINVLDPDVIVLGGGLSNIDALYERVPQLWRDWVFSDRVDTRLVRARHGDSSGVRGAAWLWPG